MKPFLVDVDALQLNGLAVASAAPVHDVILAVRVQVAAAEIHLRQAGFAGGGKQRALAVDESDLVVERRERHPA